MSGTKTPNVTLTTKCRLTHNGQRDDTQNINELFHLANNMEPSSIIGAELHPLSMSLERNQF